ncbi:hypothetical protein D3C73_631200 [compost metagenome]
MVIGGRKVFTVGAFDEGRPPGAGIVAAFRVFNLDDIRPHIRKHLACPGAGKDAGKFENADAGKRRLLGGDVHGQGATDVVSLVVTGLIEATRRSRQMM